MNLRTYQQQALDALRRSLGSGNNAPLLCAPTGSGKTHIARAAVDGAKAKGRSVLFLAPRRELIYQTSEKLLQAGIGHGLLMAGEAPTLYAPVQVASIPTLYSRCIKRERMPLPAADVVIIDEAHLSVAKMTREVIDAYPNAAKVGMTATPARMDGKALGLIYDDMVMGPSVRELTEQGYLVPARYFAPSRPDLQGVKITAGDYNAKDAGRAMQPIIGDVVYNWLRIAKGRKTVVFSINVSHSQQLRDDFRAAGIPAEHLDGNTPNEERKAILGRLRSGETQVLCNCEVLTYGWDEPSISACVIARPTKSIVRYLQMAGRVLRPSEGKEDCLIIDHTGTVDELGFVDDPVDWTLDGTQKIQDRIRERKKTEPKQITCGECATVFRGPVCPVCGTAPDRNHPRYHETVDASLQELDRSKQRKNRQWTSDEKRRFFGELKSYAQAHGYASGWASHKYRQKLGVWPNAHKNAPSVEPSQETLSWIRSRQIAWAKRRKQEAA